MSLRRLLFLATRAATAPALLLLSASALHAQTDVIRGRITGPDNAPVTRATITVTSITGNINRTTRTDNNGRYTVAFPGDEGDYFVNVAALGFNAKRFEVKRTGDQEVLIADAKLSTSAQELDPMKVTAARQKAARDDGRADIGGGDRGITPINGDQLGDLASLAASLPGVQLIPGTDGNPSGFSVLGLTADQNLTTLNGLNFNGSSLPRDANVTSSLALSPYDVSRGNFSGGALNIRTRPPGNYISRSTSLNLDSPHLQWTDAAARSLGQQYQNISLGAGFTAPIEPEKLFYSTSYQFNRRSSDLQTLLNTDILGLETAGVSADSVSRLLGILGRAGVPARVGGLPDAKLNDQASVFGTFDFIPPTSTSGTAFNITYNGFWSRQDPASASPTELPAHSGERTIWNAGIQGRHSSYFGFGVLTETSVGVSRQQLGGSPFVDLPNGSVRVNSTFADGTPGVQTLAFGGNPSMNIGQTTTTAQATNALSWYSDDNKHKIKFTSELRHDGYAQNLSVNQLGTFTFNSLSDLENGAPASFTRQLTPRVQDAGQFVGGTSLSDTYRPTDDLQIQYGVRADGNRFTSTPAANPDIVRLFGTSNTNIPNNVYFSPRIGFSWTLGTADQTGAFFGAARNPRAIVRGGVGILQNTPGPQSFNSVASNTGLPSAVQQLACVGLAAPTPNWSAYGTDPSAIPTQCADGTNGSVFASSAPNVSLFDPRYGAPRVLRSNLQWVGNILDNRFSAMVDGTYSLNMNQPATFDLNFNDQQQFALTNEGGRPVFARPTSIVASTGTIAAGESRIAPAYNHVGELQSDMRSEAKQLTFQLRPATFSSSLSWSLAYVYAQTRERYNGFNSTGGNPLDVAWGRSGFDSRHQIVGTLTYNALNWVTLGWYQQLRSGTPYTPLVASDINGDGYANDRAFIFDPSKVADPALAAGMRALMDGSGSARDCLLQQLGTVATRNSCQGPWTSNATLTFAFNPLKVRMPQRATLSFQLSNPLGAADYLMHGDGHLHGWGQQFVPTNQLLFVRGFDQTTRQYQYQVNPRFGSTALSNNATRTPVTLTAMLRVDVGPTRERQDLTQTLDRGRSRPGQKMPEQLFKLVYGNGVGINPMATILRQADTLELTQIQADSIAVLNRAYTIRLDSIWSPVSKELAALPDNYDQSAAYDRYRAAREMSVDALLKITPNIKSLLTDAQMRKLPPFVVQYLDARYLASIRSSTGGSGMNSIMSGLAGSGAGANEVRIVINKAGSP